MFDLGLENLDKRVSYESLSLAAVDQKETLGHHDTRLTELCRVQGQRNKTCIYKWKTENSVSYNQVYI